jgi:hypothetical protein
MRRTPSGRDAALEARMRSMRQVSCVLVTLVLAGCASGPSIRIFA